MTVLVPDILFHIVQVSLNDLALVDKLLGVDFGLAVSIKKWLTNCSDDIVSLHGYVNLLKAKFDLCESPPDLRSLSRCTLYDHPEVLKVYLQHKERYGKRKWKSAIDGCLPAAIDNNSPRIVEFMLKKSIAKPTDRQVEIAYRIQAHETVELFEKYLGTKLTDECAWKMFFHENDFTPFCKSVTDKLYIACNMFVNTSAVRQEILQKASKLLTDTTVLSKKDTYQNIPLWQRMKYVRENIGRSIFPWYNCETVFQDLIAEGDVDGIRYLVEDMGFLPSDIGEYMDLIMDHKDIAAWLIDYFHIYDWRDIYKERYLDELAACIGLHPYTDISKAVTKIWRRIYPESYEAAIQRTRADFPIPVTTTIAEYDLSEKLQTVIQSDVANVDCLFDDVVSGIGDEQVVQDLRSFVYTERGSIAEDGSLDKLQKDWNKGIGNRNSQFFKRYIPYGDRKKLMLGGRVDGISDDNVLVEVKNRQHRLFEKVPLYEKIQVTAYLALTGITECKFVQCLEEKNQCDSIDFDCELWQEICRRLSVFAAAFEKLLDDEGVQNKLVTEQCFDVEFEEA